MKPIVDVHCHVFLSSAISEDLKKFLLEQLPWDAEMPTPEFLLEQMDKAGVQYAVLQAYDTKEVGLEIPNDFVAELLCRYPDRFICGYASVNPIRRGVQNAVAMLKEGYEMGLRGLKLHPLTMQFVPNDRTLYPLYEKCVEYNIPVGFHIQPSVGDVGLPIFRLKFCDIVPIDELAHDFPELKIQICHFGKWPMVPDVYELAFCLRNNRNVYTDTSCPIPYNKEGILNTLNHVKNLGIADKTMFGTDFPVQPQSWWMECMDQVGLTEREKQLVFRENALRFVGRDDLL